MFILVNDLTIEILPDSELEVVVLSLISTISGLTGLNNVFSGLLEFGQLNFSIISDCF